MNASVIWYRARPSEELQLRLMDMLASVQAEAVEENVTIQSDQIPRLMALAMRTCDITVTIGGMDLRRDEENIVFLAAGCIRVPLEKGRASRSRFIYDPMRGALLPSFESAVLFPSASGGAEGAVLVSGSQTIIMLPRLEESNTDILDMIGEYLPMLIGLPEEPEEEIPDTPEHQPTDWEAMRGVPQKHYYDDNGNRLPEYIERVLARKEGRRTAGQQAITSGEMYSIFRDDELTEDNLGQITEAEETPPAESSPWEQMFDSARRGDIRTASARRYEELMSAEEEPNPRPAKKRKGDKAVQFWSDPPEDEPVKKLASKKEKGEKKKLSIPLPVIFTKKNSSPPVRKGAEGVYRHAGTVSKGAPLARLAPPKEKPLRQAAAPALRAAALLLIVSVIISACYIAFNSYEPAVQTEPEVFYQSELSAMFDGNDDAERGDLPTGVLGRFAALWAENNDVCGYISIPGTDISQPILRSYASTPDFYDHYSFYGRPDERGALHFDSGNSFDWGEGNYNLVVYGRSPTDGSMFSQLRNYTDPQYLAEHPIINLDTLYQEGQWVIFAVCLVSGDTVDEFNYRNTEFIGPYSHQIHLYNLYIRSMFYTNTEVLPDEKILTLVTDSDAFTGAKLLVCARMVREDEDISRAGASVIENPNVMMPDLWYTLKGTEKPSIPSLELPTETPVTAYTDLSAQTTTAANSGDPTQPGQTTAPTTMAPSTARRMTITSGGKVIEGNADDVLAMIIEAEMGSSYELEALKAQAVASYTYYLYSGGSAKAPSFPTKTAGDRALQAAREVLGQYMYVNNMIPYAPYYATSAGKTADNADISGTALSWLTSVDCAVDEQSAGFRTVKQLSSQAVADKVRQAEDIDLNTIADKNQWFEVLERDANDLYVTRVRVGDKEFRGNTLHLSILGYSALRSPCFWIEYDAEDDVFHFTSLGYGTGVGMSQTGANEYARQGKNYVWILQHFYPGVEVRSN